MLLIINIDCVSHSAAAAAKSLQWCPTLCDPRDGGAWDSPGKNTGVGCHFLFQCMKGKSESEVAQSCLTLHDPMVCSLPGSSIHGIFQARVLEWGAIAFSNGDFSWLNKDLRGNQVVKLEVITFHYPWNVVVSVDPSAYSVTGERTTKLQTNLVNDFLAV